MSKICKSCKVLKLAEAFSKNTANKDGLFGKCKECTNKTRAVTRKKYDTRDKVKSYRKAYNSRYYLDNKDRLDSRNKEWAILNVDWVREYQKEKWKRYADNVDYKEKRQEYHKKYYPLNRGRYITNSIRR